MKPILSDEHIRAARADLAKGETRELWGRDRDLVIILDRLRATWQFWVATGDGLEFAIDFGAWPLISAGEAFERAIVMRHFLTERITLESAGAAIERGSDTDVVGRTQLAMALFQIEATYRVLRHLRPREFSARLFRMNCSAPITLVMGPDDLIRLPRRGARLFWTGA